MNVCHKVIWYFLARFVIKMLMTKIMLFNVISVTFGSTLSVTILIILIINIYKVTMILGIVLLAQAQYFLLIAETTKNLPHYS